MFSDYDVKEMQTMHETNRSERQICHLVKLHYLSFDQIPMRYVKLNHSTTFKRGEKMKNFDTKTKFDPTLAKFHGSPTTPNEKLQI